MKFRRLRQLLVPLFLAATLLSSPEIAPASTPSALNQTPIWGTRPVIAYFLLTPDLANLIKMEAGLSKEQFQAVQEIARQEFDQIQALQRASQEVIEDPRRSLQEKRAWVTASGYNLQIDTLLERSEAGLKAALDHDSYNRLEDWIEARWRIERQIHGSQAAASDARSFKIYATRYDSNGAYTVALPDKCLKLANGGSLKCSGYEFGQNYSVQLQYTNNSPLKVTVGESGPWNVDDNFWTTVGDPQPRRMFTDLPLGMPEAQAAYFDNYNGGLDQFGRKVTSPVAIDLARQVSIDIGLEPGKNDWITVTFPWTEGWEAGAVQEVTVKEPTRLQPGYSGDMCGSSWHKVTGFSGSPAYLTLNVENAGQSTNSAEWAPDLPASGEYRVEAFIPDHAPVNWECPQLSIPRDTAEARYTVTHAGGTATVSGNQGPLANQWLDLGSYTFNAGTGGSVKLTDLTGEKSYSRTVSFSAVRFVLLNPPATTPGPGPSPTPTPPPLPPDPTLWSGSISASPGLTITIPVQVLSLHGLSLGAATVDIRYDPAVISPAGCLANPNNSFDTGTCDLDAERDGVSPDTLRLALSSAAGLKEDPLLGMVTFQTLGQPGSSSRLEVIPVSFTDPAGSPLPYRESHGQICIAPCLNLWYLPVIPKLFSLNP